MKYNGLQEAVDEYRKDDGDKNAIVAAFNGAALGKTFDATDFVKIANVILTTKIAKRAKDDGDDKPKGKSKGKKAKSEAKSE